MIRAVGNKRLFLTNSEFDVYNKIVERISHASFNETFDSDNNGIILSVFSSEDSDRMVIQFLFNIMINQRARELSRAYDMVSKLENRVKRLEDIIEGDK